jgi:hypothetical protein
VAFILNWVEHLWRDFHLKNRARGALPNSEHLSLRQPSPIDCDICGLTHRHMSRLLFLSVFSSFSFLLFAQGAVNLRGKVLDGDTNEPVEFATVGLLNAADSSLVTGRGRRCGGRF